MAAAQFYVEEGANILNTGSGGATKVEFSKNYPGPASLRDKRKSELIIKAVV